MLITRLKTLFTKDGGGAQTQEDRALELACAALMFEVARADFAIEEAEQQADARAADDRIRAHS